MFYWRAGASQPSLTTYSIQNCHAYRNLHNFTGHVSAINLVDVCIQHVAYLAGRGDVQDTIEGIYMYIHDGKQVYFVLKIMSVPVSILWLHLNHDSFTRQVFVT